MTSHERRASFMRYVCVALMLLVTTMVWLSPVSPIDHIDHENFAVNQQPPQPQASTQQGGVPAPKSPSRATVVTTTLDGNSVEASSKKPLTSPQDVTKQATPPAQPKVEDPSTPEPLASTPQPESPGSNEDESALDAALLTTPSVPDQLTKPLYATEEEKQWKAEYQEKFRTLGAKGRMEFLHWLAANKDKGIPRWRPGRNQPIVCDDATNGGKRGIYPGYYSIPTPQMVQNALPTKTKDWSTVIPANKKTYKFSASQEDLYLKDLQASRFGVSFRKGGWQSGRTLEIFGAACVPYFCDIYGSPKEGTVANFPREALTAMLEMDGIAPFKCFPPKKLQRRATFLRKPDDDGAAAVDGPQRYFNDTLYDIVAEMVRQYSAECLTTPYIARYLLSATSLTTIPKKVLVLWTTHPIHPGYMVPGWIMGMKELGVTVVDYPRQDIIYNDTTGWNCKQKSAKSWGRGYFVFCRTPETDEERRERGRIAEAIKNKEFDAVIYQFPHESYLFSDSNGNPPQNPHYKEHWPYFKEVQQSYGAKSGRILFAHDGDLLYDQKKDYGYNHLAKYGRYMRRESHGCRDALWSQKAHKEHLNSSAASLADDTFP